MVPAEVLAEAITLLQERFRFLKKTEITLEVNPENVDEKNPAIWKKIGINRISLGMQSFQPKDLRTLGRGHTVTQAINAYHSIRQAGFANVSGDLIAGLPRQTLRHWRENLEYLITLAPEHISLYLLEVHEETPLGARLSKGEMVLPPDNRVAAMYYAALEICRQHGYEQYEISNWARPGFSSCHNRKYWESAPVLGFGAGSHYSIGCRRFRNADSVGNYIKAVEENRSAAEEVAILDEGTWLSEYAIMALRLRRGIHLGEFFRRYRFSFEDRYAEVIRRYAEWGLLEIHQGCLRLTEPALIVSNEIFQEFLHPGPDGSVDAGGGFGQKGKEISN